MDNSKVTELTQLRLIRLIIQSFYSASMHRHVGISGTALRLFKSYFQTHTKSLTYLAHYLAHNTFHSESRKGPFLVLFCLAHALRLTDILFWMESRKLKFNPDKQTLLLLLPLSNNVIESSPIIQLNCLVLIHPHQIPFVIKVLSLTVT